MDAPFTGLFPGWNLSVLRHLPKLVLSFLLLELSKMLELLLAHLASEFLRFGEGWLSALRRDGGPKEMLLFDSASRHEKIYRIDCRFP